MFIYRDRFDLYIIYIIDVLKELTWYDNGYNVMEIHTHTWGSYTHTLKSQHNIGWSMVVKSG